MATEVEQIIQQADKLIKQQKYSDAWKLLLPHKENTAVRKRLKWLKFKREQLKLEKELALEPITEQDKQNPSPFYGCLTLFACTVFCAFFMFMVLTADDTSTSPNEINNKQVSTATTHKSIYYAKHDNVRLRTCQQNDCPVLYILDFGQAIEGINIVTGDEMGGITTWYEVNYGGQISYVHAIEVLDNPPPTPRPPAPAQPQVQSSGSSSDGGSNDVPENCDEAVAMGLTAEQAAQWDHLDRDDDGVACYGD